MKTATFNMVWLVSGKQTIELPDDIDTNDKEAVRAYIQSQWANIPLSDKGVYVQDSDEIDDLVPIEISEQ